MLQVGALLEDIAPQGLQAIFDRLRWVPLGGLLRQRIALTAALPWNTGIPGNTLCTVHRGAMPTQVAAQERAQRAPAVTPFHRSVLLIPLPAPGTTHSPSQSPQHGTIPTRHPHPPLHTHSYHAHAPHTTPLDSCTY